MMRSGMIASLPERARSGTARNPETGMTSYMPATAVQTAPR